MKYYQMKNKDREVKFVTSFANVKSSNVNHRLSVWAPDNALYSEYYATESRVWPAEWNEEKSIWDRKNIKMWFTNFMIFDLDFNSGDDEKDNKDLNSSLNKLYKILGKPWLEIRNKNEYSDEQIFKYFTKFEHNGLLNSLSELKVKLPKKYGVQIVYRMNEPLYSFDIERLNLFNSLRKGINEFIGGDIQCHGFQFKNWKNEELFNVFRNEKYENFDLIETAKYVHNNFFKLKFNGNNSKNISEYTDEMLTNIATMRGYDEFYPSIPKSIIDAKNYVKIWYRELNTFKGYDKFNFFTTEIDEWINILRFKKSPSRNETLLNFLRVLPGELLLNINSNDINSSNLFNNCDICEPMDNEEFEMTKLSVINWRKTNYVESHLNIQNYNSNNIDTINYNSKLAKSLDNRVLKIDAKHIEREDFLSKELKNKINYAKEKLINKDNNIIYLDIWTKKTRDKLTLRTFEENLLTGSKDDIKVAMANLMLLVYNQPEEFIAEWENFFTPEGLTLLNKTICEIVGIKNLQNLQENKLKLYELVNAIKYSLYIIHFKVYDIIKGYRNGNRKPIVKGNDCKNVNNLNEEKHINDYVLLLLKIYNSNDIKFNDVKIMLKMMLNDGYIEIYNQKIKFKTINWYQEKFHLSTSKISFVIRQLKLFSEELIKEIKIEKLSSTISKIKNSKENFKLYLNKLLNYNFNIKTNYLIGYKVVFYINQQVPLPIGKDPPINVCNMYNLLI